MARPVKWQVKKGSRTYWGSYDEVMLDEMAGHRERAYVLWDLDRVERHDVLDWIDCTLRPLSHMYTIEEYRAMEDSGKERSKIWVAGGKGYWCKDNTSRIVWGKGSFRCTKNGWKRNLNRNRNRNRTWNRNWNSNGNGNVQGNGNHDAAQNFSQVVEVQSLANLGFHL